MTGTASQSASPENECDYSLVVPAYNEEELLPRTLASLSTAMATVTPFRGELVVADNNSTDRTAEVARNAGAQVVFEPVNQISRARNAGARVAAGRYVIFIDADTTVPADLIRAALNALDSGEVCGGGTIVRTSDETTRAAQRSLEFWNWISRRFQFAAGSFVYCRRDAWEETGGFSTRVYAGEELFFSRALRRWGRCHNQTFRILDIPVDTSMRKMEWYSNWSLLWMILKVMLFPWVLRSRQHCHLWYERPPTKGTGNQS